MSNRGLVVIIFIVLALLGAALYWFYRSNTPEFNWSDSAWNKQAYSEKSEQPYGTLVLNRFLEDYIPGKTCHKLLKNVGEELPTDSLNPASYVFVGEALYMDSLSTRQLLQFVSRGSTAFISSKSIPFDLMNYVYFEECMDAIWSDYEFGKDTIARMSLTRPALDKPAEFHFAVKNKPREYRWHFIESRFFCDGLPHEPIGYFNDSLINFARFPYGKGQFLFHTNPVVFSNYNLLRPETHAYVNGVLSRLPQGDIYWDVVSRVPESVSRSRNNSRSPDTKENPLAYILQQPALAWAWYLLATTALLWVIFRAKRRQRPIPVLPVNENSSYEFISTIANLHFRERNYQGLCIQSMRLFLAQVRERYNLNANLQQSTNLPGIDDAFVNRLSVISQVPRAFIEEIFRNYHNTIQYQPTEQMMVDLHLQMEAFWKRAK